MKLLEGLEYLSVPYKMELASWLKLSEMRVNTKFMENTILEQPSCKIDLM